MPSQTKRSFAPVVNAATRVLILGSLPGDISLRHAQYYAHPRNQFWRLLEPIVDAALVDATYQDRLAALLAAGIGLWDVIGSATRQGSLDADIRDWRPNFLPDLIATLSSLRLVAFNGSKASELGRRQLAEVRGPDLISLPSSSPAYTVAFQKKQFEWNRIRRYLETAPNPVFDRVGN